METNGEDVVRGDAVAIWRYSPDSEARDTGMRRRDDYAIGKESVRGEREVERERSERGRGEWRSRDYSAVYSNGQSDPHQSQRAAPPIPLSNATGSIHRRWCVQCERGCVCVCVCVPTHPALPPLARRIEKW